MTEPTPASVAVVGIGDQPEQASGAAMPQSVAARKAALATIAAEVRECRRCPLWVGRTKAVAGEGDPDTDVVLVGEGPGINEDRQGRPFVGRAGDLLVRWLATLGWRREEVFITNVVKCRPPDNRDPEPAEIAACAPFLTRQLEILDPSLIVTLGRHSMGRFMPGARIGGVHGTMAPVHEPALRDSMVYALYHPAAALRSSEVERQSFADVAGIPAALTEARRRRAEARSGGPAPAATTLRIEPAEPPRAEDAAPPTLF